MLNRALERAHLVVNELRALDQLRTEFADTVSHELRTPVSSVLGYTEILGGEVGALTTEQRHMLERVDRNGRRLRALLEDLLELSKVSSQPSPTQRSPARVWDIVADAFAVHHSLISARDLKVGLDVLQPDLTVLAGTGHLRRAVCSLLSNAIKFSP